MTIGPSPSTSRRSPDVPYPLPVDLRVDVVAGVPVAGRGGHRDRRSAGRRPVSIDLYDDGLPNHADTFANDGVYGAFFSDYTLDGVYTFHVKATT